MEYQCTVRNRQAERAKNLLSQKDSEEIKKGPNDVKRFLKRISKAKSGKKTVVEYILDDLLYRTVGLPDFGSYA